MILNSNSNYWKTCGPLKINYNAIKHLHLIRDVRDFLFCFVFLFCFCLSVCFFGKSDLVHTCKLWNKRCWSEWLSSSIIAIILSFPNASETNCDKKYQAIQSPGVDLLLSSASKWEIESDDDFRSGCRNVGHHCRQQSFSGLHSPVRSNFIITWDMNRW